MTRRPWSGTPLRSEKSQSAAKAKKRLASPGPNTDGTFEVRPYHTSAGLLSADFSRTCGTAGSGPPPHTHTPPPAPTRPTEGKQPGGSMKTLRGCGEGSRNAPVTADIYGEAGGGGQRLLARKDKHSFFTGEGGVTKGWDYNAEASL